MQPPAAGEVWWKVEKKEVEEAPPSEDSSTDPQPSTTLTATINGELDDGDNSNGGSTAVRQFRVLCRPAYLSVFARIGTEIGGSTDVQSYFSKYGYRVSRKFGNRDVNECEFVASEANHRALMGSYCLLTFAYFKSFLGMKYTASPDGSKKSSLNPYPPGYSYVSSANRDPDMRTRVGGPSTRICVHE